VQCGHIDAGYSLTQELAGMKKFVTRFVQDESGADLGRVHRCDDLCRSAIDADL